MKRIKFWLFVLSGVLSGFAGILWTLRFASARYDSGIGQELLVVTIVLLGGISIFGGRGTIIGVVLAVAILGCLQTAMTLALVSAQDQNIVVGGLLILSVIVPSAGDLYRRGRVRLRSALARRRARRRPPRRPHDTPRDRRLRDRARGLLAAVRGAARAARGLPARARGEARGARRRGRLGRARRHAAGRARGRASGWPRAGSS